MLGSLEASAGSEPGDMPRGLCSSLPATGQSQRLAGGRAVHLACPGGRGRALAAHPPPQAGQTPVGGRGQPGPGEGSFPLPLLCCPAL